jgi:predicted N-acetyltransferase YhbS
MALNLKDRVLTRAIRPSDISDVSFILNEAMGNGYASESELSVFSLNASKVARVAETGNVVIGVATGEVYPAGKPLPPAVPANHVTEVQLMIPEAADSSMGLLKSVAVASGVRGYGAGTAVSAAVVNELFLRGAELVYSVGWTDHEGCHIEGALTRLGFRSRGYIEDFWLEDSIRHRYSCPTCGNPCRCGAHIFVLGRQDWS